MRAADPWTTHDQPEIVTLAKKFYDLGFRLYATRGTAAGTIAQLGIEVIKVAGRARTSRRDLST